MSYDPERLLATLNRHHVRYVVLGGLAAVILSTGAVELDIADGGPTLVASLDDVITAKRAAGRTKDLAALPHLEALRDELGAE